LSVYSVPQVVEKKTKPHIQVDIGGGQMKTFAPEEVSAMVLTKMKETAEAYLGKKVKQTNKQTNVLHINSLVGGCLFCFFNAFPVFKMCVHFPNLQ